ncbi:hypothetical protein ACTID9_05965 [Brevibacillus fluminis]|uniref:hypothetical protein n=1 Tax=Brevibacillus fluminis TaxID=511487 RepID=UPI003F89923A
MRMTSTAVLFAFQPFLPVFPAAFENKHIIFVQDQTEAMVKQAALRCTYTTANDQESTAWKSRADYPKRRDDPEAIPVAAKDDRNHICFKAKPTHPKHLTSFCDIAR